MRFSLNLNEAVSVLASQLYREVLARYGREAEDSLFFVSFTDLNPEQTVILQQLSEPELHHVASMVTAMEPFYLGSRLIAVFDPDWGQQFLIKPVGATPDQRQPGFGS